MISPNSKSVSQAALTLEYPRVLGTEMSYYVYTYFIDGVPEYVGKGKDIRALRHAWDKQPKTKWRRHLQKAIKAKRDVRLVIDAFFNDEEAAFAEEKRRIAQYGRRDLETGTLYNLTDGGDGPSGRRCTPEEKLKIGASVSKAYADPVVLERRVTAVKQAKKELGSDENMKAKLRVYWQNEENVERHKRAMHVANQRPEAKVNRSLAAQRVRRDPNWIARQKAAQGQQCTVDGVTVFPSKKELAAALGHGRSGTRSPTFQYLTKDAA